MSGALQAVVVRRADALAREHTQLAIDTLVDIARNGEKDSDRVRASDSLLDRGHGKPLAAIIQIPVSKRLAEELHALSDEELIAIATGIPQIAQDAEFTPEFAPAFDFEAACDALPAALPATQPATSTSPTEDDLLS